MTENRRRDDRHPDRPLDWSDTETLAGQQWKAPVSPAAAPAAGQAGLATDLSASGLLKLWDQANAEATDTMPALFVFAKLLLAAPVAATEQAKPRIPQTAQEAIDFLSSHYESMEEAAEPDNVRFQLTAHDLVSAFRWWFDFDAAPLATPADAGAGQSEHSRFGSPELQARILANLAGQSPAPVTAEPVATDLTRRMRSFAENYGQRGSTTLFTSDVLAAADIIDRYCGGAVYAERLENAYDFACEAGPLRNSTDWIKLRQCIGASSEAVATPAPADRDAIRGLMADALSSLRWMYRRLPQAYGCLPSVEKSIKALAEQVGQDVTDDLKERAARVEVHMDDAAKSMERAADAAETRDAKGGEHE